MSTNLEYRGPNPRSLPLQDFMSEHPTWTDRAPSRTSSQPSPASLCLSPQPGRSFQRGLPLLLQSNVCCCGQGQTWCCSHGTQPCPWSPLLQDDWQGPWVCIYTTCPSTAGRPHWNLELGRWESLLPRLPAALRHLGGEIWLGLFY